MSARLMPLTAAWLLTAALAPAAAADTLLVPADHPTIQAAVDAAGPGDEVLVKGGNHPERVVLHGRRELTVRLLGQARLDGKAALEVGFTIVDCDEIDLVGLDVRRSAGSALLVQGSTGVRVHGGRLQQVGGDGIVLEHSDGVELRDLHLDKVGGHGVRARGGRGLLVEDVVLRRLGGNGLLIGEPGQPAEDVVLRAVRVDRGAADGLLVLATGGLLEDVRVRRVDGHGLLLSPEAGSAWVTVQRARVVRVGGHGLGLAGLQHVVRESDVVRPGLSGIVVAGAGHELLANRVVRPGLDGLAVLGVPPAEGGSPGGHELSDTLLRRPARDGIVLGSGAPGNLLRRNRVVRAAADGLQIESSANDLLENESSKAGLNGFEMHAGSNVVRRNRAAGSGGYDLQDLAGEAGNFYLDNDFAKVNIF